MFCSTGRHWGPGAALPCFRGSSSGWDTSGSKHPLSFSPIYKAWCFVQRLHTFMCISQSPLPLCYSQIMSVDTWRRMWLFLEQSLGRQKPQAKVLLTWWCPLCCICNSKLGCIWGHTSLHFWLWPHDILVQGTTTEATGDQKVHYGRVFNGTRMKKTRASKETCGKSWSLLSNEFVFVDFFFFPSF